MKSARTFARSSTGADAATAADVVRARRLTGLVLGAAFVALVAVIAVVLGAARSGSLATSAAPGPLSREHVAAGLTCASCHGAAPARASCTGCHAEEGHRSRRAAHRALAASTASTEATLGCVDCHAAHGAHLPLVPRAACARCHDPTNVRDVAAHCFPAGAASTSCFDEHVIAPDFAVAEAARRAVDRLPPLSPPSATSTPTSLASLTRDPEVQIASATTLSALVLVFGPLASPRRRHRRAAVSLLATDAPAPPAPVGRRLPIIDASRCLGCRACVDACAFDVLEVERFVAQVVRPDACCGAVTCEVACPNGSLTLVPVDATGEGSVTRVSLDAALESTDAPMLFLAGDLTGVPLIKHAIRQGRLVADAVAAKLPPPPSRARGPASPYDVIIVGAGPAGLSATLRARELGLTVLTLEQGAVGASIRSFPRGKLVFERPLELPLEGELWMEECSKEELVAQWERVVRVHRLPVRERHHVRAIEPVHDDADPAARYRLTVTRGDDAEPVSLACRALVLALGTRGTPRPLPAPIDPAMVARVAYSLVDAASFAGRRVIVVGLGDSAMEAALALAAQPGCEVTMLARGATFNRGSSRTLEELERAVAEGRLTVRFGATVTEVARDGAQVAGGAAAPTLLPFDQMFVFIGGTGPWPLLRQAGVVIRGSD